MKDRGATVMEPLAFAFGKVDAVGEKASGSQQPEALIDGGVIALLRKEALDGFELKLALG